MEEQGIEKVKEVLEEQGIENEANNDFVDLKSSKFNITDVSTDERVTVFGTTGAGKTWFICWLMDKFSRKVPVIILDVKNEYSGIPEANRDWLKETKGISRITHIVHKGRDIRDFKVISEYVFQNAFNRGNICVVAEEIGNYIQKSGNLYEVAPHFAKYLTQGRKRNCSLIATSQRSQFIRTDIPSQSEHIFCFNLSSKHDLESVKYYFEPSWFRYLKPYQFFHKNIREKTVKKRFGLFRNQQIFGKQFIGKDKKERLSES